MMMSLRLQNWLIQFQAFKYLLAFLLYFLIFSLQQLHLLTGLLTWNLLCVYLLGSLVHNFVDGQAFSFIGHAPLRPRLRQSIRECRPASRWLPRSSRFSRVFPVTRSVRLQRSSRPVRFLGQDRIRSRWQRLQWMRGQRCLWLVFEVCWHPVVWELAGKMIVWSLDIWLAMQILDAFVGLIGSFSEILTNC